MFTGEPPVISLLGQTDYTLGLQESMSMEYHDGFMRSKDIHMASLDAIHGEGFSGWFNPVEKPLGVITVDGKTVTLVHSMQWDGAPGGRTGTILRYTERQKKKKARDFWTK